MMCLKAEDVANGTCLRPADDKLACLAGWPAQLLTQAHVHLQQVSVVWKLPAGHAGVRLD